VIKHTCIRKERTLPPLEEDKKASIRRKIQETWLGPGPTVADIVTALLLDFVMFSGRLTRGNMFPSFLLGLKLGATGDTLCGARPLPASTVPTR
jgi:hypothetical protein